MELIQDWKSTESMDKDYITCLPKEIVEEILSQQQLDISDVLHCCATCSYLINEVWVSETLWSHLFYNRWPVIHHRLKEAKSHTGWKKLYEECHKITAKVEHVLCNIYETMWPQTVVHEEMFPIEAFHEFDELLASHDHDFFKQQVLENALIKILSQEPEHSFLDKKLVAYQVLAYIRHQNPFFEGVGNQGKWIKKYEQQPEVRHTEEGLILIAKWAQPNKHVDRRKIISCLDKLADKVFMTIKSNEKRHPVAKYSTWRDINFVTPEMESLWTPKECRTVLNTINSTMYGEEGFHGIHRCPERTLIYKKRCSFIDEVLERRCGSSLLMCSVYQAVARRLGVVLHSVDTPSSMLLLWTEHPEFSDMRKYSLIDAEEAGAHVTPTTTTFNEKMIVPPKTVINYTLLSLMAHYQSGMSDVSKVDFIAVLELLHVLNNSDKDVARRLCDTYQQLALNLDRTERIRSRFSLSPKAATMGRIRAQLQKLTDTVTPPKRREGDSVNLNFHVGSVMFHTKYHYTCVIYGWDPVCHQRESWIAQMGVDNLSKGRHQPFYHVLVADGTMRYAAEENLTPHVDDRGREGVTHAMVGRYFTELRGSYYVPNEMLSKEYPDDTPPHLHDGSSSNRALLN